MSVSVMCSCGWAACWGEVLCGSGLVLELVGLSSRKMDGEIVMWSLTKGGSYLDGVVDMGRGVIAESAWVRSAGGSRDLAWCGMGSCPRASVGMLRCGVVVADDAVAVRSQSCVVAEGASSIVDEWMIAH